MKHLFKLLAISIVLLSIVSCNEDDDVISSNSNSTSNPDPTSNTTPNTTSNTTSYIYPQFEKFIATLNGLSEVPQNSSTTTGVAQLIFNNVSGSFIIKVSHYVAGANAAHIHKGAVGVNGDIIFTLTNNAYPYDDEYDYIDANLYKYPYTYDYKSPNLTAAQKSDLRSGLYYVNIHSTAFDGGEIRGQLILQ